MAERVDDEQKYRQTGDLLTSVVRSFKRLLFKLLFRLLFVLTNLGFTLVFLFGLRIHAVNACAYYT